jgi:hypothetical protein
MAQMLQGKVTLNDFHSQADQPYLSIVKDVEFQPVFILGFARSGTSLLYKLLTETQNFNYFNYYHLTQYPRILSNHISHIETEAYRELDESLQKLGIKDRVFDGFTIDSRTPGEYPLILENFKRPLLNKIVKTLEKPMQGKPFMPLIDYAFSHHQIVDETLPLLVEACKKVQYISAPNRLLLLKNPWDYPNFLYLKKVFPAARFIFIHRHPVHVLNSQINALRTVVSQKNEYLANHLRWYEKAYDSPFFSFVLKSLVEKPQLADLRVQGLMRYFSVPIAYYLENIHTLDPSTFISIRYEDLCESSESVMFKILKFLGLEPSCSWKTEVKPRRQQLLPELTSRFNLIRQKLQPYFAHFNYE